MIKKNYCKNHNKLIYVLKTSKNKNQIEIKNQLKLKYVFLKKL
jgi:hypothetical protein